MRKFRESLACWWLGEPYSPSDDDDSTLIIIGVRYRRHWTSRALHAVVDPVLGYWETHRVAIINGIVVAVVTGLILTVFG